VSGVHTFFLSYSRLDQAVALRFADDLIAAGFSVWVDQYDIRPSQHWDRAVETAVRGCEGMIVILSPNSTASSNVADEVAVAIESGKIVIPVLIETCTLPLRMTRMQFIDATRDYGSALDRCVSVMSAREPPPGEVAPAARAGARLEPQVVQEAQRRLASFMGPIARRLTAEAAAVAATKRELYARLAESIPSPSDRKSFLGWVTDPAPAPAGEPGGAGAAADPISDHDRQTIAKALTRHLGPIAPRLVERECAAAQSRADLCRRLGARIAQPADRAAFLKDVETR
jgi:hypothetical protein